MVRFTITVTIDTDDAAESTTTREVDMGAAVERADTDHDAPHIGFRGIGPDPDGP